MTSPLSKHLVDAESVEIRVTAIEDSCEELLQKIVLLAIELEGRRNPSDLEAEYDNAVEEYFVLSGGKLWWMEAKSRYEAKAEASK